MKRMIPKEELVAKQTERRYGRAKAHRSASFGRTLRRIASMLLCLCMIAAMLCNFSGGITTFAQSTQYALNRIACKGEGV